MTTYYARKEYTYESGDAIFSIPFSYIKKEHIKVYVNNVATENYTYLNSSQIQIIDTLTAGDKVVIERTTPINSKMVTFSDTSILNKDTQNLAQDQVFNAVQELYDNTSGVVEAVEKAEELSGYIEELIAWERNAQVDYNETDNNKSTYIKNKPNLAVYAKSINNITPDENGNITIDTGNSRNVGEIVTSTIPLTDAGLHLLDGSLLQYGSYKDFIDYMAELYGDGTNIPDYFCSESDWQTSVTNYGSCDKYVYDSTNNTVRLPKRTTEHGALIKSYSSGADWYRIYQDGWCEQGGDYSSGSGNKTTNFLKSFIDTNYFIGFFVNYSSDEDGEYPFLGVKNASYVTYRTSYAYGGGWKACGYIDISDYQYSPIYEYLVIANSTKTEIEVDIDEVMTDLNGKADTDLSNLTQSASAKLDYFPTTTYTDLTVGANGAEYTAPYDCYITAASANGGVYIAVRDTNANILEGSSSNLVSGFGSLACLLVKEGQKFTVHYTNTLVYVRATKIRS